MTSTPIPPVGAPDYLSSLLDAFSTHPSLRGWTPPPRLVAFLLLACVVQQGGVIVDVRSDGDIASSEDARTRRRRLKRDTEAVVRAVQAILSTILGKDTRHLALSKQSTPHDLVDALSGSSPPLQLEGRKPSLGDSSARTSRRQSSVDGPQAEGSRHASRSHSRPGSTRQSSFVSAKSRLSGRTGRSAVAYREGDEQEAGPDGERAELGYPGTLGAGAGTGAGASRLSVHTTASSLTTTTNTGTAYHSAPSSPALRPDLSSAESQLQDPDRPVGPSLLPSPMPSRSASPTAARPAGQARPALPAHTGTPLPGALVFTGLSTADPTVLTKLVDFLRTSRVRSEDGDVNPTGGRGYDGGKGVLVDAGQVGPGAGAGLVTERKEAPRRDAPRTHQKWDGCLVWVREGSVSSSDSASGWEGSRGGRVPGWVTDQFIFSLTVDPSSLQLPPADLDPASPASPGIVPPRHIEQMHALLPFMHLHPPLRRHLTNLSSALVGHPRLRSTLTGRAARALEGAVKGWRVLRGGLGLGEVRGWERGLRERKEAEGSVGLSAGGQGYAGHTSARAGAKERERREVDAWGIKAGEEPRLASLWRPEWDGSGDGGQRGMGQGDGHARHGARARGEGPGRAHSGTLEGGTDFAAAAPFAPFGQTPDAALRSTDDVYTEDAEEEGNGRAGPSLDVPEDAALRAPPPVADPYCTPQDLQAVWFAWAGHRCSWRKGRGEKLWLINPGREGLGGDGSGAAVAKARGQVGGDMSRQEEQRRVGEVLREVWEEV